jgi:hypothetical protein
VKCTCQVMLVEVDTALDPSKLRQAGPFVRLGNSTDPAVRTGRWRWQVKLEIDSGGASSTSLRVIVAAARRR